MKKPLVRIILFFGILFILIEVTSFIFIPNKANLFEFGYNKKTKYDLLSEPNNTIDAIFIGDSLIYNGISPMYIWNNYGYTTYDCAIPAATLDQIYDYSEVIVKSQSPKIVYMEIDPAFRDPRNIKLIKYKFDGLKKYVPLLTFHNNWKQIGNKESVNPYKGYKYSSKVKGPIKHRYMKKTNRRKPIIDINKKEFKKLVKLYKDNNIKFVLIETPTISYSTLKENSIKDLAKEYDLEYINLNTIDLKIDWEKETKDLGVHMNYLGARKVSTYMAEDIKKRDILKDHRNDPKYKSWDVAYELYKEKLFQ